MRKNDDIPGLIQAIRDQLDLVEQMYEHIVDLERVQNDSAAIRCDD